MQAVPPILPLVSADGTDAPRTPEKHANLVRFQAELEVRPSPSRSVVAKRQFIQCLANPMYLSELALQGYFDKPEFLNYLRYLEYWRGEGYVQYIRYNYLLPFILPPFFLLS
jgi:mediator of RNA polymerase II transcription subunit 31